jgi:hypothetical protein
LQTSARDARLLGKASFRGGTATAPLGLVLQWGMSIVIAAIYVAVTAARPAMRRRWLASGVATGVVIFLAVNYLVVPLSAAPFRPRFTLQGFATAPGVPANIRARIRGARRGMLKSRLWPKVETV